MALSTPTASQSRSIRSKHSPSLTSFHIRKSERVFLTGRTGSGKTTLADKLIRLLRYRTVVIDPKHDWNFSGYVLTDRYIRDPEQKFQLFRPLDDASSDPPWADLDVFLRDVWNDPQPTLVYVDELTEVTTPRIAPLILRRLVRLGRSRNKAVWSATQRPKDIPSMFLTEAEHWIVFDLRHADDRHKVAGFLGERVDVRPKGKYSFWYANPELADAIHVRQ